MSAQNFTTESQSDDQRKVKTGRSWLLFALPIIIVLLLITGLLLGARLYETATRDQHAVQLEIGNLGEIELFKVEYSDGEDGLGQATVKGVNGEQVVAPGTQIDYDVRLRNNDDTHIDYVLVPEAEFTTEDPVPIEVRLVDPYGNYLLGGPEEWVPIELLNSIEHRGTVRQGEVVAYGFNWRWQFESGGVPEDAYDTYLGNKDGVTVPGVEVSFTTESSASTRLPSTGGILHNEAGWGCCICCYLVWILLIVCVVLLAYTWKQHLTIRSLSATSQVVEEVAEEVIEEIVDVIDG